MPIVELIKCDGPYCQVAHPKDVDLAWIVITVDRACDVHREAYKVGDFNADLGQKFLCSPRCLTIFALVWWEGPNAVRLHANGGGMDIRFSTRAPITAEDKIEKAKRYLAGWGKDDWTGFDEMREILDTGVSPLDEPVKFEPLT